MRRWGRAVVLLVSSLAFTSIAFSPARAASLDGAPQIAGLQFDTPSVSVSGLNVATVHVSVQLKDQDGVDEIGDSGSFLPTPLLAVEHVVRTPLVGDRQLVFLSLSSGTIYDGWWQGDVYLSSPYNGQLRVAEVEAYDKQGNLLKADPASSGFDPRLTVNGTDIPRLSAGFAPSPVLYGNNVAFKGRLIHSDTGAPWPGISITILSPALDACCSIVKKVTTDSQGYWGTTFSSEQLPEFVGAAVTYSASDSFDKNFFVASAWRLPRVWWRVWATLTSSRIRLGSTTTVYGSVAPTLSTDAYLQRLVSGVWKTVAVTHAHSSGRFYLTAHPPSRGYHRYRVLIPPQNGVFIATATKTMTLYVY